MDGSNKEKVVATLATSFKQLTLVRYNTHLGLRRNILQEDEYQQVIARNIKLIRLAVIDFVMF